MDNIITTQKNKSFKCGSAIKVLSIIALICTILNRISYFFYYDDFRLTFRFPNIYSLISVLLTITPVILLVLYIFKFHSKLKATVLVPIIFVFFGLESIFNLMYGIRYDRFGYDLFDFRLSEIGHIFDWAILVCSILTVISALKGFNKKAFIIISMPICLLYEIIPLIILSESFQIMKYYINSSRYLYVFTSPMRIIGAISLYSALLLFGLKNKIPPVLTLLPKKEKARVEKMKPEQALKLLKEKLDLDMITEEEYQAQRAEIISKL